MTAACHAMLIIVSFVPQLQTIVLPAPSPTVYSPMVHVCCVVTPTASIAQLSTLAPHVLSLSVYSQMEVVYPAMLMIANFAQVQMYVTHVLPLLA